MTQSELYTLLKKTIEDSGIFLNDAADDALCATVEFLVPDNSDESCYSLSAFDN